MDTIFALSSGAPPAGIGIMRITGPRVQAALQKVAGKVPPVRKAVRAVFRNSLGEPLDDGLMLFFAGPHSVTGEDLGELHCHGGRAVIAAIESALNEIEGLRKAEPGEFTRRAFANGRIDLAEAEGLADLLAAETELQRCSAMAMASGVFSRQVDGWREELLRLSAQVEAALDFDDEDDVASLGPAFERQQAAFLDDLRTALSAPHAETLREGYRVALAGPPNAGKSTLFNALIDSEAAITAATAGTTRDVLERPVALDGVPFTFVDMAGLRENGADAIEEIGIALANAELARADLVLWLGEEGQGPAAAWEIEAQIDRVSGAKQSPDYRLSAFTGEGLVTLREGLVARATKAMPRPGQASLSARQRELIQSAFASIEVSAQHDDHLLIAEHFRFARLAFDALLGRTSTEDMLDTLFGRFCIGK